MKLIYFTQGDKGAITILYQGSLPVRNALANGNKYLGVTEICIKYTGAPG